MRIIVLGAPGAGKGTAAVKLEERYHIPHIGTGDIFRSNIREGTRLGLKAKAYMDEGRLVPDEITVGMVLSRLEEKDAEGGFILDGFPRTIAQAEALREDLAAKGAKIDYVFNIKASDELIMKRLSGRVSCPQCGAVYHVENNPPKVAGVCDKCGHALLERDDDRPETIKKRLEAYYRETAPLEGFYRDEGVLVDFDGSGDPERVFKDMIGVLG